jgi:hypothetical protein
MQSYTLDGGNMMDVSEQVPSFRVPVCRTSDASRSTRAVLTSSTLETSKR